MNAHQPMPVAGYTAQPASKVELVNANKQLEERVLRQIDKLLEEAVRNRDAPIIDARWLSIARTQIEQGFMALNRAVFMPERITLPEDTAA